MRDTDGNPVAGVWVQVRSSNNYEIVETDSTGLFSFTNLISEYMRLIASPSGTADIRLKNIYFTPGNDPVIINITVQSSEPHYSYISDTGESYSIVIDSASALGYGLYTNDEVAVIAKSNIVHDRSGVIHGSDTERLERQGEIVVGAAVYNGELPLTITAWKDDPATEEKDGYAEGDSIIFEIWSSNRDREYRAVPVIASGDGKFGTGDSTVISNLSVPRYQPAERVRNERSTEFGYG